jgi:hypothetical protein
MKFREASKLDRKSGGSPIKGLSFDLSGNPTALEKLWLSLRAVVYWQQPLFRSRFKAPA